MKNIARPVRVYSINVSGNTQTPGREQPTVGSSPPRLSIVVLPFANIGSDPEQEYFVDGVTESLTSDLSRIAGSFVIARNSAFTYKGKALDVKKIGRELNVRYVLEGSVQSSDNRIRVNTQLIDAETGAHLWAERFDKARADLFDMQDEITARLARAVGVELVAAEGKRIERERPNMMDAVDLTMRGRAVFNQPVSLARDRKARDFFEAALSLDDRNIDALVGVAHTHVSEVPTFASDDRARQLAAAEAAISRALTLAPENASAHFGHAYVLWALRAPDRALRECEIALSLNRNLPDAQAHMGWMKLFLGRPEETEPLVAEAMRLSPRDPSLGLWHFMIGVAHFLLGRLDQAVESLRKSVDTNPNFGLAYFLLAASLAQIGHGGEAAEACVVGRRLIPNFSVGKFRAELPSDNAVFLAQHEPVFEGLRRAGVPEG